GVRMAGADKHVVTGELLVSGLLDRSPGRDDCRLGGEQRINADQGGRRAAVKDDTGDGQELLARAFAFPLEEAARHLGSLRWSDVADAEPDVKHGAPPEWKVVRIMARLSAMTSQFDGYREPGLAGPCLLNRRCL